MNPKLGGKITQLQNRIKRLSELIYCSTAIMENSLKNAKSDCVNNNPVGAYHALSEAEFQVRRIRINCHEICGDLLADCWK